jgi:GDPmannose 4,6-dehydratase
MTTKLAFITGITGQDGSYLSELLLEKGYNVFGIVRRTSLLYSHTRIDHIRDKLHLNYGDMTDATGLSNFIQNIVRTHPNFEVFEIYNLAAQSHVAISFDIPEYTVDVDGAGVLRILEVIRTFPKLIRDKIRFYQAGTSEMFGAVKETPQNENTPFNPVSPYAAAKVYAHYITKVYREAYGLYAVNGILFNHESSRRVENFVTMKIVSGITHILQGKQECIELGNVDSQRDWGHAKDYVYGMWLMLQQREPEDFVLASGKTHTIRHFIEKAFAFKGIKIEWSGKGVNEIGKDAANGVTRVKINAKYFRPCEVEFLLGDARKAQEKLGWSFQYDTLEMLIEEMFTHPGQSQTTGSSHTPPASLNFEPP